MASGRSSVSLLCVCSVMLILLLADATAADLQQQQPTTEIAGSMKQFYLRGDSARVLAESEAEESFESFERRELSDYGSTAAKANCRRNCKR